MPKHPRPKSEAMELHRLAGKCGALRKPHGPRIKAGVEVAPAEDPEGGPYYCTLAAGWGTDHNGFGLCKFHGGATPMGGVDAERERTEQAVRTYGLPVEIPPSQALLEEVYRSAGVVRYLEEIVGGLTKAELKEGDEWERPSVWVQMYAQERKHLAHVATEAIKCGVAERQVRLMEQQGALLAEAIRGILTDLGVAGDVRVPEVVRRHLTLVAAAGGA